MWIAFKTKSEQRLDEIARKFGLRSADILGKHPKNKQVLALHKKGQAVAKGTVIFVPDPKGKCYIATVDGKKVVMTPEEWKRTTAKLEKAMRDAADMARRQYRSLCNSHENQRSINEEFAWVHAFSRTWFGDKGREPVKQAAAAKAAVEKLERGARKGDFRGFEAALKQAERAIQAYGAAFDEWQSQLTGDAAAIKTGLEWTKGISFVVFGAAAMTVAAPACVGATLGAGLAIGLRTAVMDGLATEFGTYLASNAKRGDPYNTETGAKRVLTKVGVGALSGIAGAGFARFMGKWVAPKIAEKLLGSAGLSKLSIRLVENSKVYDRLLVDLWWQEAAAAAATGIGPKFPEKVASQIVSRFLSRVTLGSVKSCVQNSPDILRWGETWLQDNADKVDAGKPEMVAEGLAVAFQKDPLAIKVFERIVEANSKDFEKLATMTFRKCLNDAHAPAM